VIDVNVVLLFLLRHFGPFECDLSDFEDFIGSNPSDAKLEIEPDENGRLTFRVVDVENES
jgi:hypothetical protein